MSFSIDDKLSWRVTRNNPVREVDGMDWERCAALHNLILRLGWTASERPEAEMPGETWWQKHITDQALEDEWSRRLSPSLKLFLQTAFQTPPDQNFFYYASGLSWPGQFFSPLLDGTEIMTLYQMPNLITSGHSDGLKYPRHQRIASRPGLTFIQLRPRNIQGNFSLRHLRLVHHNQWSHRMGSSRGRLECVAGHDRHRQDSREVQRHQDQRSIRNHTLGNDAI